MALGGDLSGVFRSNDDDRDHNNQRLELDYLIGWGKQKSIFKNAKIYYGWDVAPRIGYFRDSHPDSFDEQVTSTNFSTGMQTGPFLGFQYNLGDRFGIYTESNYYVNVNYRQTRRMIDTGISERESTSCFWSFSERLLLPTTLVIWWRL